MLRQAQHDTAPDVTVKRVVTLSRAGCHPELVEGDKEDQFIYE